MYRVIGKGKRGKCTYSVESAPKLKNLLLYGIKRAYIGIYHKMRVGQYQYTKGGGPPNLGGKRSILGPKREKGKSAGDLSTFGLHFWSLVIVYFSINVVIHILIILTPF